MYYLFHIILFYLVKDAYHMKLLQPRFSVVSIILALLSSVISSALKLAYQIERLITQHRVM